MYEIYTNKYNSMNKNIHDYVYEYIFNKGGYILWVLTYNILLSITYSAGQFSCRRESICTLRRNMLYNSFVHL